MGLTGMEVSKQKPLSPGVDAANLAINLNQSDFDSAHGSSNQKLIEDQPPKRKRIVILPAGVTAIENSLQKSQESFKDANNAD